MGSGMKKGVSVVVILALLGFVAWVIYKLIKLSHKVSELESSNESSSSVVINDMQLNGVDLTMECIDDLLVMFEHHESGIYNELLIAKKRLSNGEDAEAVRIIAKIVEDISVRIAEIEDNEWFYKLKSASKLDFNQLIKRFRNLGIFDQEEYQFAMKLRKFRNDIVHTINSEEKSCPNDKRLNLHTGIMLIKKLANRPLVLVIPCVENESNDCMVSLTNE